MCWLDKVSLESMRYAMFRLQSRRIIAGGSKYGGMGTDQLKELKRLQKENERLRRAVSDLTLDKLILAEAAKGNF